MKAWVRLFGVVAFLAGFGLGRFSQNYNWETYGLTLAYVAILLIAFGDIKK